MEIKSIFKNVMRMFIVASSMLVITGCQSTDDTAETEKTSHVTTVVKGYDGALLKGAAVTINEASGVTDEVGVVVLEINSTDKTEIVVKVSEDGFINQSVTAPFVDENTSVQVMMRPVKETLTVTNIQVQQVIEGETLGARISLPANSLVKPDGSIAEGNVTLNLTPWDVNNSELGAMLGNGQALNLQGNRVELISAGMMSIDFYDAEGNYLQLAPNTTAEIQMDLTLSSINNQNLSEGDTIPLWHFDEELGLWIEDGQGVVIASETSSTGMALSARVEHFSTWNWDFEMDNGGSIDVSCELSNGTPTACAIVAYGTLDDGSKFTKVNSILAEGTNIINIPTSATIDWRASTAIGLQGTQTSGASGSVVIVLEKPTTDNFVQCDVNTVAVECSVTLKNEGGSDVSKHIPATGATIQTSFDSVNSLSWSGKSNHILENDSYAYYKGTAESGISGEVALHLDEKVDAGTADQTVLLRCTDPKSLLIATCDISVSGNVPIMSASFSSVPVGSSVVYHIPNNLSSEDWFFFSADTNTDYYGSTDAIKYDDLINNQEIEIELTSSLEG